MGFPKLHHSLHSLHPAPPDNCFHSDVERLIFRDDTSCSFDINQVAHHASSGTGSGTDLGSLFRSGLNSMLVIPAILPVVSFLVYPAHK